MSRYRASGQFAYRDPGPPPPPSQGRWDADRFARERDYRQMDEYYMPGPPPPRRAPRPVYEDERIYYEDDRYGPRGSRIDRAYFEEEDYYDPRASQGQMIPMRPRGPSRQEAPPRPGLLRRQSSLDTFDRPPTRRYDDYDGYRPPARPPRINIDVPERPGPGYNRYRPARSSRGGYEYRDSRDYSSYDDVAIQDPEYYGDDGFREYREREWISRKRRDSSGERSHSRSRPPTEAPVEEVKETKEVVRKEEIKEEVKEKPYPRRGKTRMPKRLVHTKVLFDLGYTFYEEGEKTIVIEKALGPDNIDEVFTKSREYREAEVSTTKRLEAPPPSPPPPRPKSSTTTITVDLPRASTRAPTESAASVRDSFEEEKIIRETEVRTKPLSEAPRSVREWDQLTVKEDDRTVRSSSRHRSEARSKSRRRSSADRETFVERRSTVIERAPSPSISPERQRRRRRSRSRRRRASRASVDDETEIIERRIVTEDDGFVDVGESNRIPIGLFSSALEEGRQNRESREIREEIRYLEDERRALRRERRGDEDDEDVWIERRAPSQSPSTGGEVIVAKRGDEVVEYRKDRRDRSFSRTRQPSAGLIKSMMYTLT